MKSYWKWQLKNAVPFLIVVFALMAIIPLISALSFTPYQSLICIEGNCFRYYDDLFADSLLLTCLLPAFIAISIAPFLVYSYRYSLRSVDIYYQAARKEGYAKRTRSIIYVSIVLACFSFIYWAMVLILFFKIKYGYVPADSAEVIYRRLSFNFIWYLPAYFLSLVALILQFGIASFFVSKGNNIVRSAFLLILGELFLGLVFIGVFVYVETIVAACQYGQSGMSNLDSLIETVFSGNGGGLFTHNASIVMPLAFIYQFFNSRIVGEMPDALFVFDQDYMLFSIVTIAFFVIYAALGGFGIFEIFKGKEISGEYAGKSSSQGRLPNIIFHLSMGMIGFTEFASGMTSVVSVIASFLSFGVIYFALTGAYYRNFRWNKKQYIPYFITFGTAFLLGLAGMIIVAVNLGYISIFY